MLFNISVPTTDFTARVREAGTGLFALLAVDEAHRPHLLSLHLLPFRRKLVDVKLFGVSAGQGDDVHCSIVVD